MTIIEMDITEPAGNGGVSDVEIPLLDDLVRGSVDLSGRPSVRSKSGCWKSASFILGVEMAERFAYFGISSNLITYLTGPLGQSMAAAAANVNAWYGTASLTPLLGAFVADSFLGRYRTIVIASLLYIVGLGFLSLSAALHSFGSMPQIRIIFFFFSLYSVALVQGGHRPCLQALGADQFDEEDKKECKAKLSFFNWWNFSLSAGVLVAMLVLSYIQENLSWELGFGIPAIVMCFALLVFLLGSVTYRVRINNTPSNGGSPFVRISWVFITAIRNWQATPSAISMVEEAHLSRSADEGALLKFLDKALIPAPDGSDDNGRVCSIGDIKDAKAILKLVPLWAICLGYAVASSQPTTLFTKQGSTMDRDITSSFQIPAASLQSLIFISFIVFIPVYDRAFVPIARVASKNPSGITTLQRIGTGIFLCFISMLVAALIERKRLETAVEYGLVDMPKATVPMSIWWLVPQYMLVGFAEVFAHIGLQEFFYEQIPNELKSMGLALVLSILGIGSFLSSFLISVIESATGGHGRDSWFSDNLNRAHLDYFYWLLAGLSAVTFAAYVYFAKSYGKN